MMQALDAGAEDFLVEEGVLKSTPLRMIFPPFVRH